MKTPDQKNAVRENIKARVRAFGEKTLEFCKQNYLMLGYIVAALIIDLTVIAVTSCKLYMT